MRGIESHMMVFAASNDDHIRAELADPPTSAVVGERINFHGYSGEPDTLLNAKSKVWEKVQVDLHTDAELVAYYKDSLFTTSVRVCKALPIACGTKRCFPKQDPCWRVQTVDLDGGLAHVEISCNHEGASLHAADKLQGSKAQKTASQDLKRSPCKLYTGRIS